MCKISKQRFWKILLLQDLSRMGYKAMSPDKQLPTFRLVLVHFSSRSSSRRFLIVTQNFSPFFLGCLRCSLHKHMEFFCNRKWPCQYQSTIATAGAYNVYTGQMPGLKSQDDTSKQ